MLLFKLATYKYTVHYLILVDTVSKNFNTKLNIIKQIPEMDFKLLENILKNTYKHMQYIYNKNYKI